MFENLSGTWRQQRPASRLATVLALLLIVVGVVWALQWALKRDEQALFTELRAEDAAGIVAELQRMKVPYRLAGDGTVIMVDRERVHDLRMALMGKGVTLHGGVGFEIFANNDFGMTDFAQRINYQRALQGELTRTIQALEEVRQVRVHLVMPEAGLFRKAGAKPKAAVTVALKRGRTLAAAQVLGIQRLVAAAVPEIEPSAVTIVDESGVTLSRPADPDGELGAPAQMGAKSEIEQYITRKAVAVLDRAFGPGRAIVSVDVTLDHNQVRVTREDVLPGNPRSGEGALTRRRTSQSGGNAAADDAPRTGGSTAELEFQNGRRVEQVVSRPGSVRNISVGILLPSALPADRAEELKRLIAATVGLNPARGDEIALSSLDQFSSPAAAAASAPFVAAPVDAPAAALPVADPSAAGPSRGSSMVVGPLGWLLGLGLVAAVAGLLWSRRRAATPPLSPSAREDLLRQMQQWLAEERRA